MASNLYSRYIPPKHINLGPQHGGISMLAALAASTSPDQNDLFEPTSLQQSPGQQPSDQSTPSSPTRLSKRKSSKDGHQVEEEPRPKRSKGHKSLLLKKDKSIKTIEKLKATSLPIEIGEMAGAHPLEVYPLQPIPQPAPVSLLAKKPVHAPSSTWLASQTQISNSETVKWTELGIPEESASILKSKGFDHALAVQAAMIPLLLPRAHQRRGDLLVSATTGSGKTLGYVLPMISEISKKSVTRLRGLIILPTRDLVHQVHKVCQVGALAFAGSERRKIKVGMACGDTSYKQELDNLVTANKLPNQLEATNLRAGQSWNWEFWDYEIDDGSFGASTKDPISARSGHTVSHTSRVDILVCTPGRLAQHLRESDGFELGFVNWVVFDEADKLVDQSYQEFINLVMRGLSEGMRRPITKIVLSATLRTDLGRLSSLKLRRPHVVTLGGADEPAELAGLAGDIHHLPATLRETAIDCAVQSDKPLYLLRLLQEISAENLDSTQRGVLVFANSTEAAMRLSRLIVILDPQIAGQIGTITSIVAVTERKKAIRDFRDRKLSILIASDMASRGLDMPSLKYVINYDIPTSPEIYVHRVGRTARAGAPGHAFTLFLRRPVRQWWQNILMAPSIRRSMRVNVADPSRVLHRTSPLIDHLGTQSREALRP